MSQDFGTFIKFVWYSQHLDVNVTIPHTVDKGLELSRRAHVLHTESSKINPLLKGSLIGKKCEKRLQLWKAIASWSR